MNTTRGDNCPTEWFSYHMDNQSYCTGIGKLVATLPSFQQTPYIIARYAGK